MKILMTSVATVALAALPLTAQAQFFGGFDNSSVLGGLAGAGIGGAIGSNIAGSGNRDEGTAIGAAIGGLAGVGFGNSRSNFAGNPFAGSFNPGFTGRSLIGTGVGAGLGGVIGSNLAGSGVQEEGTAIGAVLGGLAGYAIANRGANQNTAGFNNFGGQGGFIPSGFNGGGLNSGGFNTGFGVPSFGNGPLIGGGLGLPARNIAPTFVPSGQYIAGPIIPVTRYIQPAPQPVYVSQPRTVYTAPVSRTITVAAPTIRLAAPTIRPTVVRRTYAAAPAPVARTIRTVSVSAPAPAPIRTYSEPRYEAPTYADCPAGTTQQSDGTCLERSVSYAAPAPIVSQPYIAPQIADCPSGTTQQSDGTCLEAGSFSNSAFSTSSTSSYSGSSFSSSSTVASCPTGTQKQSDGTCLSSAVSSYAPSYSSSVATTTSAQTSYRAPSVYEYEQAQSFSAPVAASTPSAEYCYSDSSKRYDSLGNEIMAGGSYDANCLQ